MVVLAGLSRFIIADITDAKAVGFELTKICDALKVPTLLTHCTSEDGAVVSDLFKELPENLWISETLFRYDDGKHLISLVPRLTQEAASLAEKLAQTRKRRLTPVTTVEN